MITRNVLARYPQVKVVVPHCGAYLPLAVPRMKSLTPVMQANQMVGKIDWEANLASLYYDLAGAHSPEVIRMMLTITTPDHLLYGSDYPYVAPQVLTASLARMKQYLSNESDLAPFREMILHKNAEWLFGLSGEKPTAERQEGKMIVRLAEIEVYPEYLQEYLSYANEVDRLSVEREPGVICLFPMQSAEDSTQIRILEIYASDAVYQQHLKTEHFQKYKQGTLHMVKSLKLPTMQPLDPKTMKLIFKKQRNDKE
jgi:quinol monooxygenase YgiN